MSGSSQFPPNQFIPPPFDARPHTNYDPYFFPPSSKTVPTREESEQPPQKKPRLSGEPLIPNQPRNFFPNPMMHPPNLIPQNFPPQNNKTTLFFKTRPCKAFEQGRCPHGTNCNFAHGREDLRKPPPNWQDIVGDSNEQQITKQKICRFFRGEGCPYGDKCTFLHINQNSTREGLTQLRDSQAREQQMGENWNNFFKGNGNQKTAYYKTRLCYRYERCGDCPYGDKCQYAHGIAELKSFGGNKEVDIRSKMEAAAPTNSSPEPAHDASPTKTHQPSCVQHQTEEEEEDKKPFKWKGPNHLSRIYGDWID